MTATDVLRRLLDERGVKYRTHGTTDRTWFEVGNISWFIIEREKGSLTADAVFLTPEQAIAITLGSCNCTNDCTNSERTETCHDKGTFNSWGYFTCSNCSIVIPLDAVKDAPSIGRTLPPKYCPNCGKKIVEPTTNDVDAEVSA